MAIAKAMWLEKLCWGESSRNPLGGEDNAAAAAARKAWPTRTRSHGGWGRAREPAGPLWLWKAPPGPSDSEVQSSHLPRVQLGPAWGRRHTEGPPQKILICLPQGLGRKPMVGSQDSFCSG